MADKCLTESDWKSFAKDQKLDDTKEASKDSKALHEAVLKALQDFDKKDEAKHDEMLAALKELEDVLTKQVAANAKRKDKDGKAIKDTKDVKDRLYKMLTAVEKQRKDVGAARDAKAEAEEEDSPALLTTKMIPLIREVRKGELVLQSLIAVAGKETVVLLSRKAISPARGKLLKEQMTNPGGLKFIRGECLFEANTLTFVVQSGASGLAKKLKAALLAQTELRLKVRVRGEDPTDIDEDGEDEAATRGTPADDGLPGTKPPQPDAARLAFAKRLLSLKAQVDKAVVRGDAQATQLQALLDSARQKVKDADVNGGQDELTALEKLLAAQGQAAPAGVDAAVAFKARLTEMLPEIKAASAKDAALAQTLKLQISEAGALARQRRFEQADVLLDQVAKALRQPAGVDPAVAFNARLAALLPSVEDISTDRPDEAALLKIRIGVAATKAKEKDYATAQQVLDEIERMLADFGGISKGVPSGPASARAEDSAAPGLSASAERAEQARAEIEAATGKGGVRFRALLMDWRQSMARAESEMARFAEALSNHPLVVYDPRADEIRARAAELVSKLPRFDGSLEQALTAAADARGAEELGPTQQAAAAAVDAYLKALDGNTLVRALEDTFVGPTSIYSEMQRTLSDLKRVLSAV